ncbi:hypothetical protein [Allobranchiibius sp. GilTou73]|uniref:hypothetical protein n=1 Tax=Allobranchiibius sp. GilTou73 TaxID=2904523 RepID=UPI001F354254|nr:hypothetical protein [Allobranchiibius sp. GilTou73]UIJ35862.1 hypothetical protein LVQ62_05625 [Allobranchiibius sp. GilTou73]
MNYLVCPDDGEQLKVVPGHRDGEAGLVVRCPRCTTVFRFAKGNLTPIADPDGR